MVISSNTIIMHKGDQTINAIKVVKIILRLRFGFSGADGGVPLVI